MSPDQHFPSWVKLLTVLDPFDFPFRWRVRSLRSPRAVREFCVFFSVLLTRCSPGTHSWRPVSPLLPCPLPFRGRLVPLVAGGWLRRSLPSFRVLLVDTLSLCHGSLLCSRTICLKNSTPDTPKHSLFSAFCLFKVFTFACSFFTSQKGLGPTLLR